MVADQKIGSSCNKSGSLKSHSMKQRGTSMENSVRKPFAVKDCALLAVATGRRAQNLRELRDILVTIHPSSIYYHFWGGLLRPRFDDPQFNNDFAAWCHYALHDEALAERLAVTDPTDYEDLEALRRKLVEVIEDRLDEMERPEWARFDQQFNFLRSQIVVFDTHRSLANPEDLVHALTRMSVGSVFYHFVDARRREPIGVGDFRTWLMGFGEKYAELSAKLASVDPYFINLNELRQQLVTVFENYFGRNSQ
jgi:hypothetical protein